MVDLMGDSVEELWHREARRGLTAGGSRIETATFLNPESQHGTTYGDGTLETAVFKGEVPRELQQGSCVGAADLMFTRSRIEQVEAKELCASCKVLDNCLEYALQYETGHLEADAKRAGGIWGGMTHIERFRELRRRETVAA